MARELAVGFMIDHASVHGQYLVAMSLPLVSLLRLDY